MRGIVAGHVLIIALRSVLTSQQTQATTTMHELSVSKPPSDRVSQGAITSCLRLCLFWLQIGSIRPFFMAITMLTHVPTPFSSIVRSCLALRRSDPQFRCLTAHCSIPPLPVSGSSYSSYVFCRTEALGLPSPS